MEEDKMNSMYGPEQVDIETGNVSRVGGLENRKVSALETQTQTEAAKIPAHQQQFSVADSALIRTGLAQQGLDKPMGRFLTALDNMGKDPKYTKGQTYLYIKANWTAYKNMIIEDFAKEIEKTSDPMQKQKLVGLMREVGNDDKGELLDMAMPGTVRAMALETATVSAKGKEGLSPLGKLVGEYNRMAPDDPNREAYKGAIAKQATSEGLQLTTNPDGTFTLTQGPIGPGGMTKPVQTDLQKKAISTADNIARLETIGQQFDPSFMEIETRLGATKTKWKEKLGMDVSIGEKAQLSKYSAFSRDAVENINSYIKEITGAQMSEKEADRIRKAMPDPGDGIFNGDSPTEFKGKWRSAMRALKLSQARATYLLNNGVTDQALRGMAKTNTLPSFGQIEEIIKTRNIEIEQELKAANPGAPQEQIDTLIMQQLKKEFGI